MYSFIKKYLKPIYLVIAHRLIQGTLEIVMAATLLILPYHRIVSITNRLTAKELMEDPTDRLIALTYKYLPLVNEYKKQAIAILFIWGLYDLVTGAGLLYGKEWAKDIVLWVLILSTPYAGYKLITDFDFVRLGFFILQIAFIYILWLYKPEVKKKKS